MDHVPVNRSTRPLRRHGRRDRGQVLALTAVVLIVLLGFSAFAIDLGMVYNARRQDQNAADTAALGAAISLGNDTDTVAQAIALVNSTLASPLATSAFNTCSAETIPTGYVRASGANCISWDSARTRVRVRVPLQTIESGVASVLGIDSFEHTAYAIAGVVSAGFGNVLPFALLNGAGTYECLKAGAGNVPDELCEGAYSGNFRMIDFAYFGNPDTGTTTACGNGQKNARMANNAAVGVDHQLSRYNALPWNSVVVLDTGSPCAATPRPNSAETITGNIPQDAGDGLFSGTNFSDGGPGRLARSALYSWTDTTTVGGITVNDDPLWEFIPSNTTGLDIPTSCRRNQFEGDTGGMNYPDEDQFMSALPDAVEDHLIDLPRNERIVKLLERCIAHWLGQAWDDHGALHPAELRPGGCLAVATQPCTSPVFSRNSDASENPDLWDIQLTPRFGYVPELVQEGDDLNGTSQNVNFSAFRPVFLQRLYGGNCNPGGCDIEFDPGVFYSGGSGSKANAITAFVIPAGMLPGNLGSVDAPWTIGINRFVSLVR